MIFQLLLEPISLGKYFPPPGSKCQSAKNNSLGFRYRWAGIRKLLEDQRLAMNPSSPEKYQKTVWMLEQISTKENEVYRFLAIDRKPPRLTWFRQIFQTRSHPKIRRH